MCAYDSECYFFLHTFIHALLLAILNSLVIVAFCQEELQKEEKANEDDLLQFQYLYVPWIASSASSTV